MYAICRLIRLKYFFTEISFALKKSVDNYRMISASSVQLKNFRSPIKFTKHRNEIAENETINKETDDFDENDIDTLLNRTQLSVDSGHQVFVIQPYIKWGYLKKRNTTPQLQLLESVTLIKTLRKWKVVGEATIGLETFSMKTFFGKGNLENIKELIEKDSKISAVFISVNTLTLIQQTNLQAHIGVPVFDRYTIIMHIFREHATSREAKLQIQLAELPYLWSIMRGMSGGIGEKFGGGAVELGGFGPRLLDYRKEIFRARQAKLKKALAEVREHRQSFRKIREKKEIPVVAVLGYTNAGKTSIIKALTQKESLEPQDYLFATLDVTCHLGELPSNLQVYYVDTLGFISDIPTYLIESFVSTLEDAMCADLIIHIRDISHPDTIAQNDNVIKILQSMDLPQESLENIITVGNKIDKVGKETLENYKDQGMIFVSCTDLTGIDILRQEIEKKILATVDKNAITIRVTSGGDEYDWLHYNATIVNEIPDSKDSQYIMMNVIISSSALSRFKHYFIKNYKKS